MIVCYNERNYREFCKFKLGVSVNYKSYNFKLLIITSGLCISFYERR